MYLAWEGVFDAELLLDGGVGVAGVIWNDHEQESSIHLNAATDGPDVGRAPRVRNLHVPWGTQINLRKNWTNFRSILDQRQLRASHESN